MLRTVTVLMDFAKLPPLEIVSFARNTVIKLNGNEVFPTPDVPLTQITSRANALETAENKVRSYEGGIEATIERDAAEKLLVNALKTNARYVGHLAYGDAEKIISSGYKPSASETKPAEKGEAPVIDYALSKTPGAVSLTLKTHASARAYTAVVLPDGMTLTLNGDALRIAHNGLAHDPVVIIDTDRNVTVTGLIAGVRYNVYAFTTNAAGASDLSTPVSFIAQ